MQESPLRRREAGLLPETELTALPQVPQLVLLQRLIGSAKSTESSSNPPPPNLIESESEPLFEADYPANRVPIP